MTLKASNYPTVRPSLDLNFAQTKRLDPRITYSRASSGTYFDSTGLLKSAATNEARFDHDPTTGESLGLLVEEARTNSSIYSEQLPYGWRANTVGSVIPNSYLSLDEKLTATKVIPAAGNNESNSLLYRGTSIGSSFIFSAYLKAGELNQASLHSYSNGGNWARVTFNLTTGEVVSTFGGYLQGQGSEHIRDGWWRCWIKVQSVDNSVRVGGGSGETGLFDGTKGFYICHPQSEAGSFPTSYIPTPATFTSRSTTATYYDSNGTIQTAGINVARDNAYLPDENGVFKPAGLLLEAAGTNLVTYSEDFSQWIQRNHTFTSNAATAPDGTTTADKIAPNSGTSYPVDVYQTVTPITTPITLSVWAKAAGFNVINLVLGNYGDNGVEDAFLKVNVSTGTLVENSGSAGGFWTSYSITPFPNGWYRVTATTTDSTDGDTVILLQVCEDDGSQTVTTGDGTKGILIWGAQLEASSYPTSYIPTTSSTVTRAADVSSSSTVTRAADVAEITGTNFSSWYNQSEGTFFASADHKGSSHFNNSVFLKANDNTTDNQIKIFSVSTDPYLYITNAAVEQAYIDAGSVTVGAPNKYAAGFASNDFGLSVNGGTAIVDTSGTNPVGMTQLTIGSRLSGVGQPNGHLQRLTYYPVRLSDATLQTLTS